MHETGADGGAVIKTGAGDAGPQARAMIPAWVDGALLPVEKLEVHRRGLKHKAVSVFILCGDEVLIQRRAMGKYHTPGLWANTCCTHPHWGEAALGCAVRRLDEELGLVAPPLGYRDSLEYRADVGGGLIEHELVDVFVARVDTRPAMAPNPEEVMDVAWVRLAELRRRAMMEPEAYTPWLRIYLERYSAQIFEEI